MKGAAFVAISDLVRRLAEVSLFLAAAPGPRLPATAPAHASAVYGCLQLHVCLTGLVSTPAQTAMVPSHHRRHSQRLPYARGALY